MITSPLLVQGYSMFASWWVTFFCFITKQLISQHQLGALIMMWSSSLTRHHLILMEWMKMSLLRGDQQSLETIPQCMCAARHGKSISFRLAHYYKLQMRSAYIARPSCIWATAFLDKNLKTQNLHLKSDLDTDIASANSATKQSLIYRAIYRLSRLHRGLNVFLTFDMLIASAS